MVFLLRIGELIFTLKGKVNPFCLIYKFDLTILVCDH